MLREYEIAGRGKVERRGGRPDQGPRQGGRSQPDLRHPADPLPDRRAATKHRSSTATSTCWCATATRTPCSSFRDLIEVKQRRDGQLDVRFRNLEYDLTRAIKKVVYGFQSIDNVLASLSEPVKLMLVVTPDTLPAELKDAPEHRAKGGAGVAGQVGRQVQLRAGQPGRARRGRSPARSCWTPTSCGRSPPRSSRADLLPGHAACRWDSARASKTQVLAPAGELSEASVRTAIESALKRSTSGFLKVVGCGPRRSRSRPRTSSARRSSRHRDLAARPAAVAQDYTVRSVDLASGQVPADVDVLVLIAPAGAGRPGALRGGSIPDARRLGDRRGGQLRPDARSVRPATWR